MALYHQLPFHSNNSHSPLQQIYPEAYYVTKSYRFPRHLPSYDTLFPGNGETLRKPLSCCHKKSRQGTQNTHIHLVLQHIPTLNMPHGSNIRPQYKKGLNPTSGPLIRKYHRIYLLKMCLNLSITEALADRVRVRCQCMTRHPVGPGIQLSTCVRVYVTGSRLSWGCCSEVPPCPFYTS